MKKICKIFSPPRHSIDFNTFQSSHKEGAELIHFLKKNPNLTIINIGSLSKDLKAIHPNILNLDIVHYPNTDIVADAHQLPFKDGSVDMIIFKNVLEHIRTPQKAMNEIYRVLKPHGYFYTKVPFLQPYHSVPDDYQRYSLSGFKQLHKDYQVIELGIAVGPGSMLSWILREWLAILTSFGNSRLYNLGLFFWGWSTFPIKYFDLIFKHNKLSHRLSSAFYGMYQKK